MVRRKIIPGDGADVATEFGKTLFKHMLVWCDLFDKEDWDGIIKYLTKADKGSPYKHWLAVKTAHAYMKKGDFMRARKYLLKANSLFADCALAIFLTAVICIDEGDSNAAINILEPLSKAGADTVISLSTCECCSEEFVPALIADCSFMLAQCYTTLGYSELAAQHRRLYEDAVKNGSGTNIV
jgi:tetratricopeptide (TPR) repeat protein